MTVQRRGGLFAALLTCTVLIVAACGGGATATSTPAPAPAGEATPPAAEVTPAETAAEPEATPVAGLPSFDIEALTGAIPGVDSYRTETSIGGVKQYESVVVTKPELSKAITVYDDSGNVSTRFIVIGKETWIADGANAAFAPDTSGMGSAMLMAFDPALMLGAYAQLDWASSASNLGTEGKNGIQAHHVKIDSTSVLGAAAQMPAGAAIDVWVADAGYVVAWEMTGFPEDANFAIEVTGVNDPANKVERPS